MINEFVDIFGNIKTDIDTLLDNIKQSDEKCKAKLNA